MGDDSSFRPRMMTHPGTIRKALTRPRISISPKPTRIDFKSSQGSEKIWVVQVSPPAQTTEENQARGIILRESLHQSIGDDGKEKNLDDTCIQSEDRAIQLLSREYNGVLSNPSIATKIAEIENVAKAGSSEQKPNDATDTMLAGMVPALFLGQCFSLLGVSNATGKHGSRPVFHWLSFRVLYSAIISILLAINAGLGARYLYRRDGLSLGSFQVLVFYLSSFVASCLYVRLSTRWATLCSDFEHMETMISFYGNSNGLRRRMRSLTAAVLILALVEHGLAQLNIFAEMDRTMTSRTVEYWFQRYFEGNFPYVSAHVPFSPVIAAVCIATNMIATFMWNYNDLFIMLISVAISWRFRLLNESLVSTAHEEKDAHMWRRARETFNAVSSLTRSVDHTLSVHVLLSFINNFYFICLQLLHTVRREKNTLYLNIYFTFSFGFLVLRAVTVSILAASIYEESRAFKRVLFSVSSKSYCNEVDRFIIQVTTDDIALTGSNFFSVTRSLILTAVGTITTYEVVLVQFAGLNSNS